ncbi:hypothetical protein Tco_1490055, partial [Tanacetum coccineum]
ATIKEKTINGEVQLQALVDGKKVIITESTVRRDLQLEDAKGVDCLPNATIFEQLTLMGKQRLRKSKRKDTEIPQSSGPTDNVADKAVNEEMNNSLERAATTATSLDAEQDRGNITKTQSKETPNEPSSLGTSSGGVNTPRSDEDRLKLKELMELCTNLQNRGRYGDDIMFDVSDLAGEEVFVAEQGVRDSKKDDVVSTADDAAQVSTATITNVELTLAQTLAELKSARPKAKGLVIHEEEQATTPTVSS